MGYFISCDPSLDCRKRFGKMQVHVISGFLTELVGSKAAFCPSLQGHRQLTVGVFNNELAAFRLWKRVTRRIYNLVW
jgi:hypothetical protein